MHCAISDVTVSPWHHRWIISIDVSIIEKYLFPKTISHHCISYKSRFSGNFAILEKSFHSMTISVYWWNLWKLDDDAIRHHWIHDMLIHSISFHLGYGPNGIDEIKSHPFFSTINWTQLYNRQASPPFKPVCSPLDDAFYFDSEFSIKHLKSNW